MNSGEGLSKPTANTRIESTSQPQLTLREYQSTAVLTDQKPDSAHDLSFPLLGLFGETGSLLSEAKKKLRDSASYIGYAESVIEELGDVLWYLTDIASRSNIPINALALNSIGNRQGTSSARDLSFADLQPKGLSSQSQPTTASEKTLLNLASEVGVLVSGYQSGMLAGTATTLFDRLSSVFRALIEAANEAGANVEQAAQHNIEKILDRWPTSKIYPRLFDAEDLEDEQLPRHLAIDIFERSVNERTYVIQRCNGLNIGDRLSDNIMKPDDYRFHDVFHYSYAAVLGWSPVLRSLLRIKRKSRPSIDEGQDGARAILIEEGVATWVFSRAKQLKLFAEVQPRGLSFELLKSVRDFVAGYEPDTCPLWLWEEAILQGYQAFRFLKENRQGRIRVDLSNRKLTIEELPC